MLQFTACKRFYSFENGACIWPLYPTICECELTQNIKLKIIRSVFMQPTAAVVAMVDFALPRSMVLSMD